MRQTRDMIEKKSREYVFENIFLVDDMKQAITQANKIAQRGDVVLLSPASASWGMYNNYEERGNEFKELVKNLRG